MKNILSLALSFFTFLSFSQTKILSWNLENYGKSKSETEINFIASIVLDYDIIAIQEVVAGYGGAQAIAKLTDILNQKGSKWNYAVSDPTSSSSYKAERYAFIWKTSKVKLKGKPWLEKKYSLEIDREPYFATFEIGKKNITLSNFHAITKNRNPETEIKYFKFLPAEYPDLNLIFAGDFNCPQSHTVFFPLKKMGYTPILQNQKTTLKQKCKNAVCLASEFDNIFFKTTGINHINSGIILFYQNFNSLSEARKISDHLPVWIEFSLN
ncbi:endonuclease/exonuclease/phosphatase family protein [Flavobacterium sp. 245]|uniref:endonuclease/exonuclease/phosphatase family protein n=1 Tax=Flavobacterium sp. 245 TaxID=2512115 RepID=UPI00105D210E|nr:endonuclease/exonuclease/phosphatase family protein [Flavobacterium sp. 245]TDO94016.1 endonuclease/exonuclease/phosphatase family protein [Flavobacterium sp. 245]